MRKTEVSKGLLTAAAATLFFAVVSFAGTVRPSAAQQCGNGACTVYYQGGATASGSCGTNLNSGNCQCASGGNSQNQTACGSVIKPVNPGN